MNSTHEETRWQRVGAASAPRSLERGRGQADLDENPPQGQSLFQDRHDKI